MHHLSLPPGLVRANRALRVWKAIVFVFLHANVQGFVSKSADLAFFVEQQGFPEIVGFTKTFFDKSRPVELQ